MWGWVIGAPRCAPPPKRGGARREACSHLPSSKLSLDLSLKLSDLGGGRLSALDREEGENQPGEEWEKAG